MTIIIEDLSFKAIIGLLDFERREAQRVSVECEIGYEGEYVDYSVIRELIIHTIKDGAFMLLEDAIKTLIPRMKNIFPQISEVRLKITKPEIFDDCTVSVTEFRKF